MARPRLSDAERAARDALRKQDQALKAAIGDEVEIWLRKGRREDGAELKLSETGVLTCEDWAERIEKLAGETLVVARRKVSAGVARPKHVEVVLGAVVLRELRLGAEATEREQAGEVHEIGTENACDALASAGLIGVCALALKRDVSRFPDLNDWCHAASDVLGYRARKKRLSVQALGPGLPGLREMN